MKRPDFEVFREMFLDCLSGFNGREPSELAGTVWAGVGAPEARRKVLEAVKEKLRETHNVEFEVNHRLLSVEGPVESVIIQTFHELNTIYLMEKINAKARTRMN